MSELREAQEKLEQILDQIPASGSFEGARLAKQAAKLGEKITLLCSHPDDVADNENTEAQELTVTLRVPSANVDDREKNETAKPVSPKQKGN